jgi:spermidine synthase
VSARQRGPARVTQPVDFGVAVLKADPDNAGGWTLLLDGYPQSYVDMRDPVRLEFEYIRWLASIVDSAAPLGAGIRVLHLGGGAMTLARYVAATRPGSVQRVVERDAALVALVRRELPLPRGADIRVRIADARAAVDATGPGRYDLVIGDVYGAAQVPAHLTTTEFTSAVARVLRPGGTYAVNLNDGGPLAFARSQAATLRTVFADVCLVAEPGVLRGRRFGNLVLVAGAVPLPVTDLAAAGAREMFPARLVHGEALDRFVAGARPVSDGAAVDSPLPPPNLFQ